MYDWTWHTGLRKLDGGMRCKRGCTEGGIQLDKGLAGAQKVVSHLSLEEVGRAAEAWLAGQRLWRCKRAVLVHGG